MALNSIYMPMAPKPVSFISDLSHIVYYLLSISICMSNTHFKLRYLGLKSGTLVCLCVYVHVPLPTTLTPLAFLVAFPIATEGSSRLLVFSSKTLMSLLTSLFLPHPTCSPSGNPPLLTTLLLPCGMGGDHLLQMHFEWSP